MAFKTVRAAARALHREEAGHTAPVVVDLAAAVGGILLGAGAAAGEDILTIVGAVMLALGLFGGSLARHTQVDYAIYDRLNRLEETSEER